MGCALPVATASVPALAAAGLHVWSGLSGYRKTLFFTPSGPGVVRASCDGLYTSCLNPTHTCVGGPSTAPLE